jgi:hypothetical protein
MTKSRGILPPRKAWTPEEDAQMRRLYPDMLTRDLAELIGRTEKATHARAMKLGVRKSAAFMSGPMAHLLDGHRDNGRRFQTGHKPWSAGTKGLAGVHPASRATQFKKGEIVGRNAARFIDVGGYRVNSEGYLDRKLRNDGPPQQRWERVHRLVWIEAHGPIPDDCVVVFRGGRRTTVLEEITVDRLECITRAEHGARARLSMPPELMQVHQLRGQITRQINKRAKEPA